MITKVAMALGLVVLVALSIFFPPFAILAFPLMIACLQKLGVIPK